MQLHRGVYVEAMCPYCQRELRRPKEKRYLTGKYTARYNVGYSKLYLYHCSGPYRIQDQKTGVWIKKRGCNNTFLMREIIPLDERLAREVSLYHNWKAWHEGQTTRPGQEQMGTTASEYTNLIHKDPAKIYRVMIYRYVREEVPDA